jgi:hypothetical protein
MPNSKEASENAHFLGIKISKHKKERLPKSVL